MKQLKSIITILAVIAAAPFLAQAQEPNATTPVEIILNGTTKYDGWYNLTTVNVTKIIHGVETTVPTSAPFGSGYPFFPGSSAWPGPIYSQIHTGTSVGLSKTGNIYPGSSSLYAGGMGSNKNNGSAHLTLTENNPVAGLKNIVMQFQTASVWGFDFYDSAYATSAEIPDGPASTLPYGMLTDYSTWAPTLTLEFDDTTTSGPITATYAALLNRESLGTISVPSGEEDMLINLYAFQWDLSSYADIVSFNIEWSLVEHSQSHALQLNQSSIFDGEVLSNYIIVPEPGTYAAVFGGIAAVGFLIRQRRVSRFSV